MQLLVNNISPIYKLPLVYCINWNNIFTIKITDLISRVYYMNKCKKMNGVWFFHFTNTPLLCIDVCTMQSNILKHGFNSLFIYLFPFLLPSVGNFENICDHMSIDNNHFLSYPNINCFFCPTRCWEIMVWCCPFYFKQFH